MPDSSDDVRGRVKEILRRDLKLGPDVAIGDDMPLFTSDADLDSLDMLLLVSSIEREFGFRIPNESVGESVFRNVNTLTKFIETHRRPSATGAAAAPKPAANPLDRLPHGEPFRFVSRLTNLKAGESAEGEWNVAGTEAFFAGHFPNRPLVPGVLIAEALAQLSGLVGPSTNATNGAAETNQGKLAHVDVRFERSVTPPASIVLKSRFVRQVGAMQQFEVSAEVAGEIVARGTLALHRGG
jgi:3-hydroxyacyl-[acyl-carrier-protein] dehydratase